MTSLFLPMPPLSMGLIVLGMLVTGIIAFNVFVYPFYVSPLRHLPGPKDNTFFLGQTAKFLQVPWFPELFCKWSREFPDAPIIRYLNFANGETLFVNSIEAYKQVLQTKSSYFVKPAFAKQFAHEFIGDGLPFVEGKLHKVRRAAISQPFSAARLRAFSPVVQQKAEQLIDVLTQQRNGHGNVEIESNIWKAVLDVIGLETFGLDLNHLESDESPLFDIFTTMMQPSTFGHVINYLNSLIPIRHHKKNRDALQCLLEHSDPDWNDKRVVEYVLNLLILGHDTTACSITWAVHELSRRPDCQQRLREEITSMDSTCSMPGFSDIDKLPYLHNFVREVLRLYCAVAMAPRQATDDVEIDGIMIPKGAVIQLSPAVMNMHPLVWGTDAQEFNPDRWSHLTGEATSAYAFETFHNGPRMCIGKQLSFMEMKIMLVEMVRKFKIEKPLGNEEKQVEVAGPAFTLRPKENLVSEQHSGFAFCTLHIATFLDFVPPVFFFGSAVQLIILISIFAIIISVTQRLYRYRLKNEGNKCFQAGDYVGADSLYSKAIIADPKNPALYTNRAMARLKLSYWDSVITDCEACLQLTPDNMKARYYLAQAQIALRDYDAALENALHAHKLCADTGDRSLAAVTALVLRCKKERWDNLEKKRVRESQDLERKMLELLTKDKEAMLAEADDGMEKQEIEEESDANIERMKEIFERARADGEKKREVPDWAIDDISFGFMVDPVMTKTGKSYERASIMEHLNRHHSDPLTREPLVPSELRPNLALKQACEEFLEHNGWAADW
ncbi:benzoate 4-monooxygenase cytochrome P450 [Fusarium sp. NRRL 52700]|nr:benzoate 4-monooxygenase cytochrome P450 [Fusarium sp. NRRL 52700]